VSPRMRVGEGLALVGAVALLVLMFFDWFDVGRYTASAGDEVVDVTLPAYLGLVAAALIPLGAFLSIRDERTRSSEARAYTPPPPRSVPGT
jgi:hypothetical protein